MENTITVDLSNCKELKLLEQAFYKDTASSSIVSYMLGNNYQIDSEAFKEYHDEYVKNHTIVELLKNKIYTTYVSEEVRKKATFYEYDFENHAIKLTIKE